MMTAKVFENGRSQAVRLPQECRFNTDEVAVNRMEDDRNAGDEQEHEPSDICISAVTYAELVHGVE